MAKKGEAKTADLGQSKPSEEEKGKSEALKNIVEKIKKGEIKKVVALTGPELSKKAGFPDLQSFDEDFCKKIEKYKLPFPEALLTPETFMQDPKILYGFLGEIFAKKYTPTEAHCLVRLLQDKEILLRNYTQCVDGLDMAAGVKREFLVRAHGTVRTGSCPLCMEKGDEKAYMEHLVKGEPMFCDKCESPLRPDMIFFGESTKDEFNLHVGEIKKECDLLIIIGCAESVMPFSNTLFGISHTTPRLIIGEVIPEIIEDEIRPIDAFVAGDFAITIPKIVNLFGWTKEFEELLKQRIAV